MKSQNVPTAAPAVPTRTTEYFARALSERAARVDRTMTWLLAAEWLGMICAASIVSPRVWEGSRSALHPHVIAALAAGPCFILPTIGIAWLYPARGLTRHIIAIAQILVSVLLIDVTGGRIETHFHIFGSLAFLAFYRDWRVLITASAVTAADHIVRGIWWPQSVYGVLSVSPWRWVEHAWWVSFEDFFLIAGIRTSLRETYQIASNRATLYEGANHDVLTGLANRRLLQERFDCDVDAEAALLFIDLDRFKQANDTLGHAIGDRLLIEVAKRFREIAGTGGILSRVGGDEFVVLLQGTSARERAEMLAPAILGAMVMPFSIDNHDLLISASIGISIFPEHGTTLSELQARGDQAMYSAKARGRNQVVTFSPEVSRRERVISELAEDISAGMERGEFELHFQPLVQRSGQLAGFEALLRWSHPVHGPILPADFIPVAEKCGLIVRLGDWVLREACRNCRNWQRPGLPPLGIAVNVSPLQFDQHNYPERVFSALAETRLDPTLLTLELTEGVLIRDTNRARAHLTRIRLAGVRIALDDFGTGYCSLSYLAELPADLIKLDKSFINRELSGSDAVIESIIGLAHRLGLTVVAEGIETSAQNEGLKDLMCDQFQGYYFSRPIAAKAVSGLLDSMSADEAAAHNAEADTLLSCG